MNRIDTCAERLWQAEQTRTPCEPVRDLLADEKNPLACAYAAQKRNVERRQRAGRRIVGRKIGLTSPAAQRQLGLAEPIFGTLLDDMAIVDGEEIAPGRMLQARVEAEVALVLERDLLHERHTVPELIGATAYALAAIEVVDSRIATWDVGATDMAADNAASCLFVLGTQPAALSRLDLGGCRMELRRGEERLSTGQGTACLGSPFNAARWLADRMVQAGTPLRAGDIVLTGALGPMIPVSEGETFTAWVEGFAPVRAVFAA